MHYVYILKSQIDGKLYTGYTPNLKKRLRAHNAGKVQTTRHRKPLLLVYYEAYLDEGDAREREKYFKSGWGRNYIKTHLQRTLMKAKV